LPWVGHSPPCVGTAWPYAFHNPDWKVCDRAYDPGDRLAEISQIRQCFKTLISGGGGIYAVHAGVVKSLYY